MGGIRDGVESHIKKNDVLHCILKVIKNRRNQQFLEQVLSPNLPPEILVLGGTSLKTGRERGYFLINFQKDDVGTRGFCAIFRYILAGFCIADYFGFIPYVNVEGSLYNVPGGYCGCSNMYQYYFKTADATLEDIKKKENYICFRTRNIDLVYNTFSSEEEFVGAYRVTEPYLREMGRIMNRYVSLKDELAQQFEKEIGELLGNKKVLGVHIRGTDFNAGLEKHPVAVQADAYFAFIDEALENGFESVFIATDDDAILEKCKERYGDKCLFYSDTRRSENGIALHMQKIVRQDNEYYLGKELLRDMYTLAACEGLVSGLSQVSFCAQIAKYAKNEAYEYKRVLDYGVNQRRDLGKLDSYKEKLKKEGIKLEF